MTAWVVRGGELQDELEALDTGVLAIGYDLRHDLSNVGSKAELKELLRQTHRDKADGTISSWAGQIWVFMENVQERDLIVMPRRGQQTVAIGKMAGGYQFRPDVPHLFHDRAVTWVNREVPRDALDPDLRKSMDAPGTIHRPSAGNAEQRLRAVAETGQDPGTGGASSDDTRWGPFIAWARRFYEWDQYYERERRYKLQVGERLAAVKQAVREGSPDWEDLLRNAVTDRESYLRDWRVLRVLLALERPRLEEALRRIWGIESDGSLEQRVNGFQEFGPFGTAGVMASILLMADDPASNPMYACTPLRKAYQLTGYPMTPNDSPDAWTRYEHALGFWDEFIRQGASRGLEIQDRLDAQSLVWCVTQYGRDDLPEHWTEELKDELLVYRGEKVIEIPPPPPSPAPDPWSPVNVARLADDLLWESEQLQEIIDDLKEKHQVIFHGPPGTGKTYVAMAIARHCREYGGDFEIVQFHPSYSYEDFVEGFRPRLFNNNQPGFELVPGPLRRIAEKAGQCPDATFILIIDELNRGNVAKVFGELYFLLEYRNEEVRLQYGGGDRGFKLLSNLWFICTMNTADRSIALMDAALRRRFYFAPFFPDALPIKGLLRRWLVSRGEDTWVADLVDAANSQLERDMASAPATS